ncbi:MAG TPA: FMN-binding negative transcriptional regulator [Methylomirabilota bacterium]
MIFHDYYAKIDAADIHRFVLAQEMGRLVTVGGDGTPHVGLYPFLYGDGRFDLHLVRADEQVADLKASRRSVFEVDEVLGVIPSYWVHPEYGGSATAYHRTVIFECDATVIEEPAAVAAQQIRLLERYQPEGGFRPVAADDPLYAGAIALLAAVRLDVVRVRPKWKLGQNRPPAARRKVIAELRKRGRPGDARAADALAWTLGDGADA